MPRKYITPNLTAVLANKTIAGVTLWNRLEGQPRAENFDRALRAEVRDALWMLTRQWQLGEFRGDDAGSPITAKLRVETTRIRTYQPPLGSVEPFDDKTPLEARAEQIPVPFVLAEHEVALDIRLLMGRYWLKLVDTLAPAARSEYITRYPVHAPDPTQITDAPTTAHQESWSAFAAATRAMDGKKFYDHVKAGGEAALGIAALVGHEPDAATLARRFVSWFEKLIAQPQQSAWEADRLEYQFACSAPAQPSPTEKGLVAEEYYQGRLDWYSVDVDLTRQTLGAGPGNTNDAHRSHTFAILPAQVTFPGMPDTRWWAFEDGRTNFGAIKPDTTDLAKLLLIEFGLVYANDWLLVPFTVPAGCIANITGMVVTDVFGERLWIDAAGRGDDDDWQRWAMFSPSTKGSGRGHQPADTSLLVLPTAQNVQRGQPLEEVLFVRDEMANMVWGIEKTITLPSGEPKAGANAAYEMRAFFVRDFERRHGKPPQAPPGAPGAQIRYQVMSEVAEHWIPLIPVHIDGDNRETQLQRAAMLRILDGDIVNGHPADPTPIRPRTSLLRVGLDGTGASRPYVVHEEEVSRAGVRVTQAFCRTRWRDGRVWVWLGVRKQTGRGEGSSGLAFDRTVSL
jgi:hypothetical protein